MIPAPIENFCYPIFVGLKIRLKDYDSCLCVHKTRTLFVT